MKRSMARELCMKILYEMSMQKKFDRQTLDYYLDNEGELLGEQKSYVDMVVTIFLENMVKIDSLIEKFSIGWHVDRMAKVDLAILRLSVTEMLFINDIPDNVSINEALELAKKYSTEESSPFINGILGKIINREE